MTYDEDNRLLTYNGQAVEYDAENVRTAVITNGIRNVLGFYTEKKEQIIYTYGTGLVSERRDEGDSHTREYYYHYNHLGSTMALSDKDGNVVYRFVYDTYGELRDIQNSDRVSLKTAEETQEITEDVSVAELANAAGIEYLYNGKYGVSTDRNGLYYMRARYYDQDIKRFINRDVVSGDITNSQSLNRYCYVQGNPVSLTDPFGLCPTAEEIAKIEFRRKVHVALDIIGIFFDGADVINALLYMAEGDDINAALSVVFLLPGVGSLAGLPIKYAMKLGGNIGESVLKLGKKFAPELVENGSRFIRNIGGKIDDAGRWINRKIGKLFGEGGRGTVENITEPVAAGPSLVQQGEGYNLKEAATKISPVEGYTDVVIHGTSDSFGVWHNGKWEYINQRSLATFLKNNPEYNGGAVRLISCSTGAKPDGIAQQLANKLGVDVLAPSDTLYIYQNGSTVIGPNPYTNTGDWKLFMPGKY